MPQNAQNFNRYSYALNNPLVYIDPSGYKIQGGIDYNPGAIWYMNSVSRSIKNAGTYYSSSFHTCGVNLSAFYGNYSSVSGGVYLNYRGDVVSFNTVKNNYLFPNSTIYHPVITSGPGLNPYLTGFLVNKDGSDKYQYLDNVGSQINNSNSCNSNVFDALGFLSGLTAGGYQLKAYDTYNNIYWKGKNGKYYTHKLLRWQANGKYVRGVNAYRNSARIALRTANTFKTTGRYLGGAGVILVAAEGFKDGDFTWGDGINVVASGIGIFVPVYGVIDFGFVILTGESISKRIGNAVDNPNSSLRLTLDNFLAY